MNKRILAVTISVFGILALLMACNAVMLDKLSEAQKALISTPVQTMVADSVNKMASLPNFFSHIPSASFTTVAGQTGGWATVTQNSSTVTRIRILTATGNEIVTDTNDYAALLQKVQEGKYNLFKYQIYSISSSNIWTNANLHFGSETAPIELSSLNVSGNAVTATARGDALLTNGSQLVNLDFVNAQFTVPASGAPQATGVFRFEYRDSNIRANGQVNYDGTTATTSFFE